MAKTPPLSKSGHPIRRSPVSALAIQIAEGRFNRVLTQYQFATAVFHLYQTRTWAGSPLNITKAVPNRQDLSRYLRDLIARGTLLQPRGYPAGVYRIATTEEPDAATIACGADPLLYLSHLSAMELHGLTDRLPQLLFVTTPPPPIWAEFASERMVKDLGNQLSTYRAAQLPAMRRVHLKKILGFTVVTHYSAQRGAYVLLESRQVRATSIGRTFLDMLRQPASCGGITHVLSVWEAHASRYIRLIVDEIQRNGAPIDKVRAGYILQERLGLSDSRCEEWIQYVQRGGSRRLDPTAPYSSTFSPRWGLSINVTSANAK